MGRTDVEAWSCAARIAPTTRAITKQYWVAMSERFRMKVGHFFIFAELRRTSRAGPEAYLLSCPFVLAIQLTSR
jgi:hypothetical protein